VSTFFGPSGPPPGHPFWTRFWEKYSLFVGNGIFIGSILGVKKGGSFCRKLQNFKKFMFWPPRTPPAQKSRFLMIFDPPHGMSILTTFWAIFKGSFLGQFWSIFHPPVSTFINDHFRWFFNVNFQSNFSNHFLIYHYPIVQISFYFKKTKSVIKFLPIPF
jgi:hypothetical protein